MRCVWLPLVLLVASAQSAFAHEVRPAYLQLHQTAPDTYGLLWKVPGRGENLRLSLYVELPATCTKLTAPRGEFAAESFTERWTVRCAGGLSGGTIRISGLSATMTDVLVRQERLDGTTQLARLTPAAPSFVVEAAPDDLQVAGTYLRLGVEHILSGADHLLFVLALLFLVKGWRRLVATVTAFTLAHSLTLAAATLGYVHVPQQPVEAVIALSIAFVAAEIVRSRRGTFPLPARLLSESREAGARPEPDLAARSPWLMAFAFGLLHGFGFAGALREAGLPQTAIPVALLFFNLGVELGQLLFIAGALPLIALARRTLADFPPSTRGRRAATMAGVLPAYAIGSVAALWVIQRLASF